MPINLFVNWMSLECVLQTCPFFILCQVQKGKTFIIAVIEVSVPVLSYPNHISGHINWVLILYKRVLPNLQLFPTTNFQDTVITMLNIVCWTLRSKPLQYFYMLSHELSVKHSALSRMHMHCTNVSLEVFTLHSMENNIWVRPLADYAYNHFYITSQRFLYDVHS